MWSRQLNGPTRGVILISITMKRQNLHFMFCMRLIIHQKICIPGEQSELHKFYTCCRLCLGSWGHLNAALCPYCSTPGKNENQAEIFETHSEFSAALIIEALRRLEIFKRSEKEFMERIVLTKKWKLGKTWQLTERVAKGLKTE